MAHPCRDPNRATQCRAQSVAANSRRIGDVAPKSRYTPQIKVSDLSPKPPVALSSHSQQRGGRGGLVEGIAALLGSENGSRYRGVSQLQSHQSRYSVQLSSRTPKPPSPPPQKVSRRSSRALRKVMSKSADKDPEYHCTQKDYRINSKTISVRSFLHQNYRI